MTHFTETIAETQKLWVAGRQQIFPLGAGQGDRKIYDAKHSTRLPGTFVRGERDAAVADEIVNRAHEYAGYVRDFYRTVFNRNSIDGNGMDLVNTVHFGRGYDNAFWNSEQMVYGDGDGEIFSTFVLLDVVGHELTHGVTENTSGLEYHGQSGALNEHVSDVFGALVEQWVHKQTADQATWLVGKGIFTPKIHGRALRDMKNPGTAYDDPRLGQDPQPAHMKDYVYTSQDNGGVHFNSGIPNRAFVLFALAVGGNAWEKPGVVWFHTRNKVGRNCDFQEFAETTVQVAQANFPDTVSKLKDAWAQVGITIL